MPSLILVSNIVITTKEQCIWQTTRYWQLWCTISVAGQQPSISEYFQSALSWTLHSLVQWKQSHWKYITESCLIDTVMKLTPQSTGNNCKQTASKMENAVEIHCKVQLSRVPEIIKLDLFFIHFTSSWVKHKSLILKWK